MDTPAIASPKPSLDTRLAFSPAEAARLAGIGRTTLYEALGSGALRSFKIGSRRLITVEALKAWLADAERGSREAGYAR
jgi:excisionase family DNA binding protein